MASDKPLALVAVRLNDVAPGGASTRVTVGLMNLTHHLGHDKPQALVPGQAVVVEVELDDIAHAFPAGHRIALSLSSNYWADRLALTASRNADAGPWGDGPDPAGPPAARCGCGLARL